MSITSVSIVSQISYRMKNPTFIISYILADNKWDFYKFTNISQRDISVVHGHFSG